MFEGAGKKGPAKLSRKCEIVATRFPRGVEEGFFDSSPRETLRDNERSEASFFEWRRESRYLAGQSDMLGGRNV